MRLIHLIFLPPSAVADMASEQELYGAKVPDRAIGDVALQAVNAPTGYPASWPPHVRAAMARRKGGPLRLYADGIFDMFHYVR